MSRIITINEVKKHNRKGSVWMIINNDVYNVTNFLDEHPGGEESLLDFAGKEASQAFEDIGHSDDARELMKKYKIGTLPEHEHNKEPVIAACCPRVAPNVLKDDDKSWRTYDGSPASESNWKLYLLLALLGAAAIGAIVKMKMG